MTGDDRRELEAVGDLLDSVLARIGGGRRPTVMVVRERWSEVAGPGWDQAEPIQVRDGVLTVEVPDGGTASRLRYDTASLLRRISALIGAEEVRSIRLRVARRGK
jgi:predicted nucleic acid-binding Zn ribbon protein